MTDTAEQLYEGLEQYPLRRLQNAKKQLETIATVNGKLDEQTILKATEYKPNFNDRAVGAVIGAGSLMFGLLLVAAGIETAAAPQSLIPKEAVPYIFISAALVGGIFGALFITSGQFDNETQRTILLTLFNNSNRNQTDKTS